MSAGCEHVAMTDGFDDNPLDESESLDSDEVRNDDGDEVVDPPEGWSGVTKFGMSAEEEREGESLDQRLAEEEPDVTADTIDERDADADEVVDAEGAIDGSDVATSEAGVHRGQIDGAPEDGESLFPVVEDVTRKSDEP